MGKMKETGMTMSDEQQQKATAMAPTTSTALAEVEGPAVYEDEGSFQKVASDYYFYSPAIEFKDDRGIVRDTKFVTLRGIPLYHAFAAARENDLVDDKGNRVPREYFMVTLTAPCLVRTTNAAGNKEEVVLERGDQVWVDVKHKLRTIKNFLPVRPTLEGSNRPNMTARPTSIHEVVVRPTKRRDLKGGHKMWDFDILSRELKVPPAGISLIPAQMNSAGEVAAPERNPDDAPDDIGF